MAFKPTRLSIFVAGLLVTLYVLAFFLGDLVVNYAALIPGRTLPLLWNVVTAGFLTTNPLKLAFEVIALLLLTRLVEPVYGSKEFLKFLLIVDLSVNVCVVAGAYLVFVSGQDANGDILYTRFSGFHGILAGIFVAVKQVMPEHEAKLFGVIKLTFKYLPLLFLVAAVGLSAALGQYSYIPFLLLGTYNAWLYLRFFQQQPDSPHRGDSSDDFKFSGFFPPFLAPVIDPIGYACGMVFRLRHAPAEMKAPFAQASQYALGGGSGSTDPDANRRRERGAKALEERLGMKKASGQGEDLEKGNAGATAPGAAAPAAAASPVASAAASS